MSKPQVFLIDAHALCYRAFFAVKDLHNTKGQATNAIFGFVNILKKLNKDFHPKYMAVCFDTGRPTKRHMEYEHYKEHRSAMPEDLVSQIPLIKEVLKGYRIPIFEKEGFEADDLLASLAKKFSKEAEVIIVSDDKDLYQLINDSIKVYSTRQDRIMGEQETKERFGVLPEHIVDYLAIVGDTSDNIPGVKGIGEVGAKTLILQYGSFENIVAHQDELKGKLREKIIQSKEDGFLSKKLATLDKEIPLDVHLMDIKVPSPDHKKLFELFSTFEFKKLAEEFSFIDERIDKEETLVVFSETGEDFFQHVSLVKRCAIWFNEDENKSLSFVLASDKGVYHIHAKEMFLLEKILTSQEIVKIVFDLKPLLKWAYEQPIDIKGECFDVHLAGYLLMSGQGSFDLETLSWKFLKRAVIDDGMSLSQATTVLNLYEPLKNELLLNQAQVLLKNMELPLVDILVRMEMKGVKIDLSVLERLNQQSSRIIDDLTTRIYKISEETFNLNSPKQLGVILFEKLGLKTGRKTKTGYSTDEETLSKLVSQHEIISLILEYRQISKLRSTYIEALPKLISQQTGRIHCSFDQTGTETGRLSSNHPNLQNIPIRTSMGKEIRKAFVPSTEKHVLLSADYSQIELRVLADLAQEENMKKAFHAKEDIHRWTAGLMFDVSPHQVNEKMRYQAKRINFGIIYGMSPFGLAKDLEISHREASDFIDRYFLRFPGIRQFMDQKVEEAQQKGYVETLFHRRRYLPDIYSKNPMIRQFAQRQAINTPVQGTAADMIKLAMVQLSQTLKKEQIQADMMITVHDELVFDVFQHDHDALAVCVKRIMEQVCSLSVPIEVSLKSGPNWAEMQEILK